MSKYLVTGGAGFIGSNLAAELVRQGHQVRVFDNYSAGKFSDRIVAGVEYLEGDVRDGKAVERAVGEDTDGVFHLAAVPRVMTSVEDPLGTELHNVIGTLNVLLAARSRKVRVVFSSSSAVYGDQPIQPFVETMLPRPLSPYGLQKYAGEEYCRLFNELYEVPTVSLRYFNIYGPHMDPGGAYALVVGKFLEQRRNGQPLTISGDGEYYREYLHVADVVQANILAVNSDKVGKGERINIGSGRSTSVNELARLIGGPTSSIAPRVGDPRRSSADCSLAYDLLGWRPTIGLEEGLAALKISG